MPELPEVETICRDLKRDIVGLTISAIDILDPRVIRMPVAGFKRALLGQTIRDVHRRGKAVIVTLERQYLIVQPMMTGQLVYASAQAPYARDTRVVFTLGKAHKLLYNDQRLFGRVLVVNDWLALDYVKRLGPEPWDKKVTVDYLVASFKTRSQDIKTVLMDHRFIAGIGNIYASEILYTAGVSPLTPARRVKRVALEKILSSIRTTLELAIRLRGTSMRNYRDGRGEEGKFREVIRVYAREGLPCQGCGDLIVKIVQHGRSTFYCKKCQL